MQSQAQFSHKTGIQAPLLPPEQDCTQPALSGRELSRVNQDPPKPEPVSYSQLSIPALPLPSLPPRLWQGQSQLSLPGLPAQACPSFPTEPRSHIPWDCETAGRRWLAAVWASEHTLCGEGSSEEHLGIQVAQSSRFL